MQNQKLKKDFIYYFYLTQNMLSKSNFPSIDKQH